MALIKIYLNKEEINIISDVGTLKGIFQVSLMLKKGDKIKSDVAIARLNEQHNSE